MPIDTQAADAVERIMKACRDADVCPKTQQAITAEITAAYEQGMRDVLNHLGTNKT